MCALTHQVGDARRLKEVHAPTARIWIPRMLRCLNLSKTIQAVTHTSCVRTDYSWISRLEYTSYSTSTTMPSMHLDQMITLTGVTIAVVFHMYMAFCAVAYLPYVFLDSTAPAQLQH